jgi:hypothetical protein
MNQSILHAPIPPGWVLGEQFAAQSDIVSVTAGAGVNATQPVTVLSKEIPPAARIYLDHISFRVVDQAGFDQLYFALLLNGAKLSPWNKISGEQILDDHIVPVGAVLESGLLQVAGINISGTSESGASANAVDVRTIVRFSAYLLRNVGNRR